MAFVNHDVAEIVGRVVGGKKVRCALFRVNVERLIRGHVDAGISGVVPAVRVPVDLRRVRPEGILQSSQRLGTQLVAVTDKERPAKLASNQQFSGECGRR
jgi:hypothetical protein